MTRVDIKFRLSHKWSEFKKWVDAKIGYRDKTGNIIKCRYCKSKNLDCYDNIIDSDWCSIIEKMVRCNHCGANIDYK